MPRIHAAADIAVSASVSGEGFSNVVGEAMACGVPCVVTDVGDSADIVAETGVAVPPWNSTALAEGCLSLLKMGLQQRRELGRRARERIATHYDIDSITHRYAAMWRAVAGSQEVKAAA
jgi:glycosyltransferase involved in cell wall biosynthesis